MRRLLLLALLLVVVSVSNATITYVNYVGVGSTKQYETTAVTVPSGATFAIIGISSYLSNSLPAVPSPIKYGGQVPTLVAVLDSNTGYEWSWMYQVSGFGAGSQTFICDWPTSGNDGVYYNFLFFSGVDLTTPIHAFKTAFNTSDPPAVTTHTAPIASTATDYLVVQSTGFNLGYVGVAYASQTPVDSGMYPGPVGGSSVDYGHAYKAESVTSDSAFVHGCHITLIGVTITAAALPPSSTDKFFSLMGD